MWATRGPFWVTSHHLEQLLYSLGGSWDWWSQERHLIEMKITPRGRNSRVMTERTKSKLCSLWHHYRGPVFLSTDSQSISKSLKWCRDVNAPAVTVYYSQYKTNSCIAYEDDVTTNDASLALRGRLLWVSITPVGCWDKWCSVHGNWVACTKGLSAWQLGPKPQKPECTHTTPSCRGSMTAGPHHWLHVDRPRWPELRFTEDTWRQRTSLLRTQLRSVGNLRQKHLNHLERLPASSLALHRLPNPFSTLRGNFQTLESTCDALPCKTLHGFSATIKHIWKRSCGP